ncbi:MAG: Asp-tRNA(Asn)/Glu-tRNA(Gln) amidotransferase GatCAB subunit C, partial [Eubacterium sp.]|nr:Asp-tRNA(Asn)/Glu-tRNA(Gln) amidotransferase GatCAB subunit C [Eubacterium sp.]
MVEELNVLSKAKTTPMIIADETDALEDTRLRYRYLDIRVGVTEPGGELVLMHGFTVCRPSYFTRKPLLLRAVVEECAQFLAK